MHSWRRFGLFSVGISTLLFWGKAVWLATTFGEVSSKAGRFEKGLRPQRGVVGLSSLSAAGCKGCHEAEYKAWKTSRHASAWTNLNFQAAFRHHPIAWCVYCHAPLPSQVAAIYPRWAEPQTTPDPALVSEGITCVTCHLREGKILSSRPPSPKAQKEHPTLHAPDLKQASFCAGCHQFNFPHQSLSAPPTAHPFLPPSKQAALPKTWRLPSIPYTHSPMQNTYEEWRSSHAASQKKTCQTCHMPKGQHHFPGSRDLTKVRRALHAEVRRDSSSTLRVIFRLQKIGHRLPSGDPFRRLRLEICSDRHCRPPLRRFFWLRRFFLDGDTWRLLSDSTLPPPTSNPSRSFHHSFRLDPAKIPQTQTLWWRLSYSYSDPQFEKRLPPAEAQAILYQGPLPPPSLPSRPSKPIQPSALRPLPPPSLPSRSSSPPRNRPTP